MKRGQKPLRNKFNSAADYLLYCVERPYWSEHHRYECEAIRELIAENRRLKTPWYKRKRK